MISFAKVLFPIDCSPMNRFMSLSSKLASFTGPKFCTTRVFIDFWWLLPQSYTTFITKVYISNLPENLYCDFSGLLNIANIYWRWQYIDLAEKCFLSGRKFLKNFSFLWTFLFEYCLIVEIRLKQVKICPLPGVGMTTGEWFFMIC